MNSNDRTEQLLTQILETQRAHFEEYKRVTSLSLELQRHAVETQSLHVLLYRRVIVAIAIAVLGVVAYALWFSELIA